MRYAGQGYEMSVACPLDLDDAGLKALRRTFDEQHQKTFGRFAFDEPIEIVSYRLRAIGCVPPVKIQKYAPAGLKLEAAVRERRAIFFNGARVETPVYQRDKLDVGHEFVGPTLVDQLDCTTVIPPHHHVRIDAYKNMIVTVGAC